MSILPATPHWLSGSAVTAAAMTLYTAVATSVGVSESAGRGAMWAFWVAGVALAVWLWYSLAQENERRERVDESNAKALSELPERTAEATGNFRAQIEALRRELGVPRHDEVATRRTIDNLFNVLGQMIEGFDRASANDELGIEAASALMQALDDYSDADPRKHLAAARAVLSDYLKRRTALPALLPRQVNQLAVPPR